MENAPRTIDVFIDTYHATVTVKDNCWGQCKYFYEYVFAALKMAVFCDLKLCATFLNIAYLTQPC